MHEKNSIMKSKPIINLFINNSCKHNHCIHIYINNFFFSCPLSPKQCYTNANSHCLLDK